MWLALRAACGVQIGSPADLVGVTQPVFAHDALQTTHMTRARKWLLGVGAASVAMMHGQFAYASASGTLAGTTTIDGLRYHTDDGTKVTVEHATVDLQPWALLG